MESSDKFETVISGSFKFKPEIDAMHEHFADYGVLVLAPDTGWLYKPRLTIVRQTLESFRPLPSEVGLSPSEVEAEFLHALSQSDFLYLMNLEGYIGQMTAFELGFALGRDIPIYAKEPIDERALRALEYRLDLYEELKLQVKHLTIPQILNDLKDHTS